MVPLEINSHVERIDWFDRWQRLSEQSRYIHALIFEHRKIPADVHGCGLGCYKKIQIQK